MTDLYRYNKIVLEDPSLFKGDQRQANFLFSKIEYDAESLMWRCNIEFSTHDKYPKNSTVYLPDSYLEPAYLPNLGQCRWESMGEE